MKSKPLYGKAGEEKMPAGDSVIRKRSTVAKNVTSLGGNQHVIAVAFWVGLGKGPRAGGADRIRECPPLQVRCWKTVAITSESLGV